MRQFIGDILILAHTGLWALKEKFANEIGIWVKFAIFIIILKHIGVIS